MTLVVVDFNVVFSALVSRGKPLRAFELNEVFNKFEYISTQYMYTELDNHLDEIMSSSKLSREESSEVLGFIKSCVEVIPFEAFSDKAQEAIRISPHLKDVPYVALALKYDCKIFSGDKGLKNRLPEKVLTPSEAVDILLGKNSP